MFSLVPIMLQSSLQKDSLFKPNRASLSDIKTCGIPWCLNTWSKNMRASSGAVMLVLQGMWYNFVFARNHVVGTEPKIVGSHVICIAALSAHARIGRSSIVITSCYLKWDHLEWWIHVLANGHPTWMGMDTWCWNGVSRSIRKRFWKPHGLGFKTISLYKCIQMWCMRAPPTVGASHKRRKSAPLDAIFDIECN